MTQHHMKRILIIRPSAIGDIVMASPMIRVLRQSFPTAYIAWLAEPHVTDLLCHHPALDAVIEWPKSRWKKLFSERRPATLIHSIRCFQQELKRHRFDLVLDAQGLLRSRLLARLSGAPERIGFDSGEPGKCLMTRIVSRGPSNKEMGSEYHFLMQAMGLSASWSSPEIAISPDDDLKTRQLIEATGITQTNRQTSGQPFDKGFTPEFAVLCPFTTRPQKHWINERWGELSRELKQQFNLASIMLGGPGDIAAADEIMRHDPETIHNLTGKTTLGQSAAVIKQASVVIGVDTGLTHMGTAFDRPTVALFGSTCPYLTTYHGLTTVLYHKLPCAPCKRTPTCNGRFDCMAAITVDQVCITVENFLSNK
jgi:heptosyltransferase-1